MTTTKINQNEEAENLNSLLKLILLFFIFGCAVGRYSYYIFPAKKPAKYIIMDELENNLFNAQNMNKIKERFTDNHLDNAFLCIESAEAFNYFVRINNIGKNINKTQKSPSLLEKLAIHEFELAGKGKNEYEALLDLKYNVTK